MFEKFTPNIMWQLSKNTTCLYNVCRTLFAVVLDSKFDVKEVINYSRMRELNKNLFRYSKYLAKEILWREKWKIKMCFMKNAWDSQKQVIHFGDKLVPLYTDLLCDVLLTIVVYSKTYSMLTSVRNRSVITSILLVVFHNVWILNDINFWKKIK